MILRFVFYDIEENTFRTKVANKLRALGMVRLQKSVFIGKHTEVQWRQCKMKLDNLTERYGSANDKIYAVVVSQKMLKQMDGIAGLPDIEAVLNEPLMLWI